MSRSSPLVTFCDEGIGNTSRDRCLALNQNFSTMDGNPFLAGIETDSEECGDSESEDQFSRYVAKFC